MARASCPPTRWNPHKREGSPNARGWGSFGREGNFARFGPTSPNLATGHPKRLTGRRAVSLQSCCDLTVAISLPSRCHLGAISRPRPFAARARRSCTIARWRSFCLSSLIRVPSQTRCAARWVRSARTCRQSWRARPRAGVRNSSRRIRSMRRRSSNARELIRTAAPAHCSSYALAAAHAHCSSYAPQLTRSGRRWPATYPRCPHTRLRGVGPSLCAHSYGVHWTFQSGCPSDEPYRVMLMAIRRRYATLRLSRTGPN